jgi:hypothetical protein
MVGHFYLKIAFCGLNLEFERVGVAGFLVAFLSGSIDVRIVWPLS